MESTLELKKILVALDLSPMDEVLMKFASYMARHMNSDRIYFVHIAQNLDMPEELREIYRDTLAPMDESICRSLEAQVKELVQLPPDCEASVEVHEGNASDKCLKLAKRKDVDLIILGSKRKLPGKGAMAHKFVKATHRSVVLVPEQLPRLMDRLLVAVDFSEHSRRALEQAMQIKQSSGNPVEITCQHAYQLPSGWSSTGKSEEEFSEIMRTHAQNHYQAFIKKLPAQYQGIPCVYTLDSDRDPVKEIYQQAVKMQADLILIGSKGKSAAAAMLMGSVAERLANHNHEIPLFIVKDKNENIGFLEALFKI
jgi:nucleotide-binding universal stress UspA family protein